MISHLKKNVFVTIMSLIAINAWADNDKQSDYKPTPIKAERYVKSDVLYQTLQSNVTNTEGLSKVVDIDHSRRAAKVGNYMPPSHVLMFSNGNQFESDLLSKNRLAALDLPLRVLAYEKKPNGAASVIWNDWNYIASRYKLDPNDSIAQEYNDAFKKVTKDIPNSAISTLPKDTMQPDGIIRLESDKSVKETVASVVNVINKFPGTVLFKVIDYKQKLRSEMPNMPETTLILYGAPQPGGRAMQHNPDLGLDTFCQKLLVWRDGDKVKVSYNDVLAMGERHEVENTEGLNIVYGNIKRSFYSRFTPEVETKE